MSARFDALQQRVKAVGGRLVKDEVVINGRGWCGDKNLPIPDPPNKSWLDYFPGFCTLPEE